MQKTPITSGKGLNA
jgi:serine/threonine protein kinase